MGNKPTSLKSINNNDEQPAQNVVSKGGIFFGNNLKKIMVITNSKNPHLNVPWPLHVLTEHILKLKGLKTEGIFRKSAKMHEMDLYVNKLNEWNVSDVRNVHIPANVLKKFLRELEKPLIPSKFHQICISEHLSDETIRDGVINRLPKINRIVLLFLIDFLVKFTEKSVVEVTKMDIQNLAIIFAPNCFQSQPSNLKNMNYNQREILFMEKLIESKNIKHVPYL